MDGAPKDGGAGGGIATSGFTSSKIETEVRGDAAALIGDGVEKQAAYERLRMAYSPNEVSDQALKDLLGIAPIEPVITNTSTPPTTNRTLGGDLTSVGSAVTNAVGNTTLGLVNYLFGTDY
jgi:hypothetical protein